MIGMNSRRILAYCREVAYKTISSATYMYMGGNIVRPLAPGEKISREEMYYVTSN